MLSYSDLMIIFENNVIFEANMNEEDTDKDDNGAVFWTNRYMKRRGLCMNNRDHVAKVIQELINKNGELEQKIQTVLYDDMRAKLSYERTWMETPKLERARVFLRTIIGT